MSISNLKKIKKSLLKYSDLIKTKEFNSVVLSTLLPKTISFFIIPFVILKGGLNTWGNYTLLISQAPFISLFFSLGIDAVIIRGIAIDEQKDKKRADQIFSSLFFSMLIGIFISLALLTLRIIDTQFAFVIILASSLSIRFGFERALVKWKLSEKLILFQVIPNLGLSFGYLFICISNQVNTTSILIVNIIQAALAIIIILFSRTIKIELKDFFNGYKNNFKYIKYLLPSRIFAFSVEPIYSYFLFQYSGSSVLGIYNFIYRILSVNTIFERIINNLWVPRLYKYFKTKKPGSINITTDKHSKNYEIASYGSIIISSFIGFTYLLITQKPSNSLIYASIILLSISLRLASQTRKNKFFSILLASDYPKLQVPLSAAINSCLIAFLSYLCVLNNSNTLIFFVPSISRYFSTYALLYGYRLRFKLFSTYNICIITLVSAFALTTFLAN